MRLGQYEWGECAAPGSRGGRGGVREGGDGGL